MLQNFLLPQYRGYPRHSVLFFYNKDTCNRETQALFPEKQIRKEKIAMKRTYFLFLGGVLLSILMAACEVPLIGGPDIQATATVEARQHQIETETVILVGTTVALSGTQTAQAMPTAIPTVTSTSTPAP